MKNSSNRLLRLFQWTSSFALILFAVSLSRTASAQVYGTPSATATFTDIGASNQPPIPGTNDIYQTNTIGEFYSTAGLAYTIDNSNTPAGTTFVTGSNSSGYVVTNVFVQTSALGSNNDGGLPVGPIILPQQFQVSFYQIGYDPSGLGSNATLITRIVTKPGVVHATGDWLSFSNIQVFLNPGTTNAFTWGRITNGTGLAGLPLVTNSTGTHPGPFTGDLPCVISNAGGAGSVNYGAPAVTTLNNGASTGVNWTNVETVFSIGMQTGFASPLITTNPLSYQLLSSSLSAGNLAASFTASATGSSNALYGISGYWQVSYTAGAWVAPGGTSASASTSTTVTGSPNNAAGATVVSTLSLANITSSDVASYRFIITNSLNGTAIHSATSAVAAISVVTTVPNSFEDAVVNGGYGAVAFWPLNESSDPSTGTAELYEHIGGFNGIYGWNSANGASNTLDHFSPAPGPSAAGLAGFPSNSVAFGIPNTNLFAAFAVVPATPTFPGLNSGNGFTPNSTNVTIIAWLYPIQVQEGDATVIITRPTYGSTWEAALRFAGNTSDDLGYNWDNNNGTTSGYDSGLTVPLNQWSMAGLVITPSNSVFYLGNTNVGLKTATQTITNENNPWGGLASIGADQGDAFQNGTSGTLSTLRTYGGYISSLTMFANSLTASNMETLLNAGLARGAQQPFFTLYPTNSYEFVQSPSGDNATFAASAYGSSPTNGGYWQMSTNPGVWNTLTGAGPNGNAGGTTVAVVSNFTSLVTSTLTISNAGAADVASYRMIVTNLYGNSATSSVATISFLAAPAANSFGAAVLTPAFGAVAYWPLNESGDPSAGGVEAYDVLGGHNGFYGTNAQVGSVANSFIQSYSNGLYLLNNGNVQGPLAAGLPGLPATSFDSLQNIAALPNTYVTIPAAPTFPSVDINETIVGWIYPNIFTEGTGTGVVLERASGPVNGINYNLNAANSLGYHWDNNNSATTGFNTGLQPASNLWSMVALVTTSTNLVLYVANTNQGFLTATQTIANTAQTWGGSMAIGSDTGTVPGRNFGGKMSSVAMFSNALSYSQIATLFDAGLAANSQKPFIIQNPLSTRTLNPLDANLPANFVINATFAAAGYGGANNLTNGGYWQRNTGNGNGWVTLTNAAAGGTNLNISTAAVTNTNNLNVSLTLTVSNISSADVGSYWFIITNSWDNQNTYAATSSVATLSFLSTEPVANGFEQYALTNGIVAFWPLNELGDPSSGAVEAYDIVGGFNGLYGAYAQDGAQNSQIAAALLAAGAPANLNYGSVPGPSSVDAGFSSSGGALGSIQNVLANTFVTTLASPTLPAAGAAGWNTNLTIIAWINPKTNEAADTGLLIQRANGQTNGLSYGPTAGNIGYTWNGTNSYNNGSAIPTNQWSMVAMVLTASNTTLYVAKTNGVLSVTQTVSNANQTWGGPLSIGGDPAGGGAARSFGGYMSSVAMFTNSLSSAQIEGLFLAGYTASVVPPPAITIEPVSTNLMLTPGIQASITASAFGFPPINGYWQKWNGSAWGPVPVVGDISGATSTFQAGTLQQGALVFSSLDADDQGSYQLVFTNKTFAIAGTGATSYVVNLQLAAPPLAGTFASVLTNAAYGTAAYWPLNEQVDPSSGLAVAFDVIGGFNGVYGVNAQDGAINQALKAAGGANYLGPIAGPGGYGLTGLPFSGALASLQSALPNTFVTTAATPSLPGLNSASSLAVPNSTNLTIVEWIYPRTNGTAGAGLFLQRGGTLGASRTDGLYLNGGPILSGAWDNNAVSGFAGPAIPLSNWSMVALVVTPGSNIYYVGTNNLVNGNYVLISSAQTAANVNEPFGGGVAIGGDPGNPNNGTNVDAVSFGGFISSVAMFTNSLTVQQMETLFVAGENDGVAPAPLIITQPAITYYELVQGASLTISANGYGAQGGGYWQLNNGGGYAPVYTPDITGTNLTANGTLLQGNLQITNFQPADAGQYQLVLTNAGGAAYSVAVTVALYNAPPGSYAAVATSKGYGAVAFWPLNETVDPSTGNAIAYELIGGFNGTYGVNANNGGGNAVAQGLGYYSGPQAGPAASGLLGFPAGGAYGSIQNTANTAVTMLTTPTFPGLNGPGGVAVPNSTNLTIVAWVYPTIPVEPEDAPFLVTRAGYLGANRTDAFRYNFSSADNDLTSYWDNANGTTETFDSGLTVLSNMWNMVAFVETPSNLVFYLGNAQNGLTTATETFANDNEPWGFAACIGSDPGSTATGRVFNGAMSSVTMFSNSLSPAQVGSLLNAGIWAAASVAPLISAQPPAAIEGITGTTLRLASTAYCGTNAPGGYWQEYNGTTWTNLANTSGVVSGATNTVTSGLSQVATLSLVMSSATAGSYRAVFTNGAGSATTIASAVANYAVPAGGFALTVLSMPGAVAFWPLDETVDPSTGSAVAYELIGGFNGTYAVNANNGGGNVVAQGLGYYSGPQPGPGAAGLSGFPALRGALGSVTNTANTFVSTLTSPTFPGLNGPAATAVPNSTNVTIVAWCNPNVYPDAANAPFLIERGGVYGATRECAFRIWGNASSVSVDNDLGFAWDNDVAASYAFDSGLNVPVGIWSMVALVISPSNAVFYLANTNQGFVTASSPITNVNEPWGAGVEIGSDPGSTATGRAFGGAISSVVMFSNSLTVAQISSLFAAGLAQGNPAPFISANPPFTNYNLLPGGSATITAVAYAGPNGGGYWQMFDSAVTGKWTNLAVSSDHPSVSAFVPAGSASTVGNLVLTNVTAKDVGSYQCVFTNASGVSATSAVVQLQPLLSSPSLNSFAYVATEPGYGMVAYWPLNESGNVATNLETCDVWGGWNGIYGTNAADGAFNILTGPGTTGPGSAGYTGFPSGDASLGSSGLEVNSYMKTAASPTMAQNTNMTILAWINPLSASIPDNAGLVFMQSPYEVDGLTYGADQDLGYIWNGANGVSSGATPLVSNWSMVALAVTATNTTFYVFATNGVQSVPLAIANPYQSWGFPLTIGGNPGTSYASTDPALTFTGDIADVAIFSNALSQAQLGNLFYAGLASGSVAPSIYLEPVPTEVYNNRRAEFTVGYTGFGNVTNQWQYYNGTAWVNVANGLGISGATSSTLVISNATSANAHSYRVIVGNVTGTVTNNTAVSLAIASAIGSYAYPQAVTNLNPLVYYRLNEAAGALYAFDYWGGLTGTYGNYPDPSIPGQTDLAVTAGAPGVNNTMNGRPIDFPQAAGAFENNNTAADFTNASVQTSVNPGTAVNSEILLPPLTTISNGLISNNMTITMWINPNELQTYTNGLFFTRGVTVAGLDFAPSAGGFLGYNWNNNAGTYNWAGGNANLIPAAKAWNFVALVITPTNGTLYCYNKTSQLSALNAVANASLPWADEVAIGNDLATANTGQRQFDGAIDEVAVFNYALSSSQINGLWLAATGIPVPAVIQTPPAGPTDFVNLDSVITYTVGAVNGPLFYQWLITNANTATSVVLTNGANGYPGSLFSGAATAALAISNLPALLAGQTLMVSVTNSAVNAPATATVTLPQIFPTAAIWTVNFAGSNVTAYAPYGGGTFLDTGFNGFGAIGQGTIWNNINVNGAAVYTNVSSTNDMGTIASTGVSMAVANTGNGVGPNPQNNNLLDLYISLPASSTPDGLVVTGPAGYYNVFVYAQLGTWGNRGSLFTYNGIFQTNALGAVNIPFASQGGPLQPTLDESYILFTNYVIFTNIFCPTGTINFTTAPDDTQPPFNGLQVQLIQPYAPLAFTERSPANVQLTWAGGVLQASGTVNGTFTNVTASGVNAVSPYTVPAQPKSSAIFYTTFPTNMAAPGIPSQ
jgi:hypothetical protein